MTIVHSILIAFNNKMTVYKAPENVWKKIHYKYKGTFHVHYRTPRSNVY